MTLVLIWFLNIMCFFYRKDVMAVINSRNENEKLITALVWTIWILFSVITTVYSIFVLVNWIFFSSIYTLYGIYLIGISLI